MLGEAHLHASLAFLRAYFASPGLTKTACDSQRQLRLLDIYNLFHTRTHFLSAEACVNLRDLNLLAWLLDPDNTHVYLAVCTPSPTTTSTTATITTATSTTSSSSTTTTTSSMNRSMTKWEDRPVNGLVEYLYFASHPESTPAAGMNGLGVGDPWSTERPGDTILRLLRETISLHVGIG